MVCVGNASVPGKSAMPEPAARGAIALGAGVAAAVVADAVRTVVETVIVARAGVRPGVTVGGSNAQVVCGGRLPLAQLNVISELYGPLTGVTVTTWLLVAPAASVASGGETSTEKSVTVICRSFVAPNAKLLLLAATLTADVPAGHVIVVPGAVPQPPVQ